MCQLTFAQLQQKDLLKLILTNTLVTNTLSDHKEGVGLCFYSKDKGKEESVNYITRDQTPPAENYNFFKELLDENFDLSFPVIAHVRKATIGNYSYTRFATRVKTEAPPLEHVHPFQDKDKRFILAHNGTLKFADEERDKNAETEFPNKIDSQIFTQLLGETFNKLEGKSKTLPNALRKTMKLFYGKFAFLIHDLKTREYYIIRGKATLYISEVSIGGKPKGFVINTEYASMVHSLFVCKQVWEAMKGTEFDYTKPELLDEETIYISTKTGVKKHSKITQNERVYPKARGGIDTPTSSLVPVSMEATSAAAATTSTPVTAGINTPSSRLGVIQSAISMLNSWMTTFGNISLLELDQIYNVFMGSGLISATLHELKEFNTQIAVPVREYNKVDVHKKRKRDAWRTIKQNLYSSSDGRRVYTRFPELNFPYFYTPIEVLEAIEEQTSKKEKESVN